MKQYAGRMVTVLLAQVVVYEALAIAKDWELISEAMDRWRAKPRRRTVIDASIYLLALHLTRLIKARFDPLAQLARWFGRR